MKKTLLLVDGSSYLYRAFHAMPDLRNAKGEPTGALYGVISMLRRLLQDYKADYAACVFDAKGKTFRDDIYPLYKGHRPSMPEELAAQIEPIHRAVAALGWPVLTEPGVEADDIIGTLANWATREDVCTIVSTGDKDLAQLVNEHVELVNTMTNDRQDIAGVMAKFGVKPEQIVDFLMLTGDAVDNIPGVPKVGPKTAAKWLAEYGTIEALVANAHAIKGVAGENLRGAIPNFELTRQLLTVKIDCEIPSLVNGLADLTPKPLDRDTLLELYDQYGFRSWLRELSGEAERIPEQDSRQPVQPPQAPVQTHYETILDWADFDRWLADIEAADLVAMDTETTSLDPMQAKLVGISLAIKPGVACYIPVAHRGPDHVVQLPKQQVLERLRPWLENSKACKLLHNSKYDAHVLANEGIHMAGITEDTMLQAYVLESHKRVNLQELGQRWLGRTGTTFEDLCGKGAKQICFDEVDVEKAAYYASEDADFTLQLHQVLRPQVAANAGLEAIYQLEIKASRVLTAIERNGVGLDAHVLAMQSHELGQQLLSLEKKAY
ncbi:MAG TPA: 5'-3' exonuclease H3TH domain-containing protein, partial [Candidimonas sp.]|nr:5'-3' exonuclease H3TH domain-containing protein [Candidimonas sp.]